MEKESDNKTIEEELASLELKILITTRIAVCLLIGMPITYFITVGHIGENSFSYDSEIWGTFGDFIGGILNPIIAFAAFYWLTQSVLIQKKELSKTQNILLLTEKTQKTQRFEHLFFSLIAQMNTVFTQLNTSTHEQESIIKKLYYDVFENNNDLNELMIYAEFQNKEKKVISPLYPHFFQLKKHGSNTDHYFIIIYQLLKLIFMNHADKPNDQDDFNTLIDKTSSNETEKFYSSIVRSFLNKEVTHLLAINCMNAEKFGYDKEYDFPRFRALIERYSMLEHIKNINDYPTLVDYYGPKAFGENRNAKKLIDKK